MIGRLQLFEYVVLQHPTKEEGEKGVKSTILLEPTRELAKDDKSLATIIARKLPESVIDKLEQIEIIVRPF